MMPYFMKRITLSYLFLLGISVTTLAQTKRFVVPGAPTSASGNSWANPLDLQAAINNSIAGDSVFAAQGTYQLAAAQSFSMKEGVKIYGGFAGTETTLTERDLLAGHRSILKGNGASVIKNSSNGITALAVLDGFFLISGNARSGGGMYNLLASPTISNCVFKDNIGGGMFNEKASTTIIKCIFEANTSSTFYQRAGGVSNFNADGVNIINCLFIGNRGYSIGAIWAQDVDYRNMVTNIFNCTFYANTGNNAPGSIYFDGSRTSQIKNCIIWGSTTELKTTSDHSLGAISNNIIQGGYLLNWEVDPLFVNPAVTIGADNIWGTADDGLRLRPGSPAFDLGTPNISGLPLPATDMGGAARVQGGRIDIGAYESTEACLPFTTLHVDSSIAASGNGGSWATAFKTLNEALIAANRCTNVANIYVAKGTYQPSAKNSFNMVQHVKMYGGFPGGGGNFSQRNPAAYPSILKGNNNSVLYNFALDPSALLDGFTITGGRALWGGGIYNHAALTTINNCIFANNETYMQSPSVGGGSGGGIYNYRGSDCIITNCQFIGNKALNSGSNGGGAILNAGSSPFISHCIFTNNTGAYGGAIYNASGTRANVIQNSVFAGNTASGDGGAIANTNVTNQLINVTFVNNTAAGGGGAIDNWSSNLLPANCIFYGNTAGSYSDIWHESGSLDIKYSLTQTTLPGTGNVEATTPPFMDIANPAGADGIWYTADDGLVLKAGSPCINAGTPDTTGLGLGLTDVLGNPRIAGRAIDFGAYEFSSAMLPVTLISFKGNLNNTIAQLQWQTAEETTFSHFVVQKSTDGVQFQSLGNLAAKGSYSSYVFNTVQQEPTAYYRLKQVDIDDRSEYSRILKLSQTTSGHIKVYPNPASSHINIQVPTGGSMSLFAANGKLVKTLALRAGLNTIDVSGLAGGLYYGVMNDWQVKFIKD
jgi:hypothetical protein